MNQVNAKMQIVKIKAQKCINQYASQSQKAMILPNRSTSSLKNKFLLEFSNVKKDGYENLS